MSGYELAKNDLPGVALGRRSTARGRRGLGRHRLHDLLRELFEILPAAREFVLDEALAGLRPATLSGDPLIGPSPGDPLGDHAEVLYAVGHYRGGVLFAPATAERIVRLVLGG